jgi:hypothetical protein
MGNLPQMRCFIEIGLVHLIAWQAYAIIPRWNECMSLLAVGRVRGFRFPLQPCSFV